MSSLIIFTAIIAGGCLGILTGFALFMMKDRGGCEECGKGCYEYNFYCGDDCEICLADSEIEIDDDESDEKEKTQE